MEQWIPLITLAVGFLARGEYVRFTERGRLPGRIAAELDMLAKLPEGNAHDELREHIEDQVRYLVAHEDPTMTVDERHAALGHFITLLGGVPLLAFVASGLSGLGQVAWVVGSLIAAAVLVAVWRLGDLLGHRMERRQFRLRQAEGHPRTRPSGRPSEEPEDKSRPEPPTGQPSTPDAEG